MKDLTFNKDKSVLIIVDMQNAFISPEGSLSKMGLDTSRTSNVIKPIIRLKNVFEENHRPVIYLKHTHRPDGGDAGLIELVFPPIMNLGHCFDDTWDGEIIKELAPSKHDYIIKKHRFSGFYNTNLDDVLRQIGVDNLVVTGIATDVCVESTIRDAFYRDYNVFVPIEATASYTEESERGAFANFRFAFARVLPLDEMIAEF